VYSLSKIFYDVFGILYAVNGLEKGSKHHANTAVMTLVLQIVFYRVEISTSLVLFGFTVAADWTPTIKGIIGFGFE
jgi:hypothetical protein